MQQEKAVLLHLEQEFKRNILEIGAHLTQVRDLLRHNKQGGFEVWIEEELGWSRQMVYNYINVHQQFATVQNFGQLALPASAMYLLAEKRTPETARQEVLERVEGGEPMTYKQVQDVVNHCRRSGKSFKSRGTSLGNKRQREPQGATPEAPQTLCIFCKRRNLRVYAFDASGSGICLPCARNAMEELQGGRT